MPKRMREQVTRDREAALAQAKRRGAVDDNAMDDGGASLAGPSQPTGRGRSTRQDGAHFLSEDDDIDFNALFSAFEPEDSSVATQPGATAYADPEPARSSPQQAAPQRASMPGAYGAPRPATPRPTASASRQSGGVPAIPSPPSRGSGGIPAIPSPPSRQSGGIPAIPSPPSRPSGGISAIPSPPSRPSGAVPVAGKSGPLPRSETQPDPEPPVRPSRPAVRPPQRRSRPQGAMRPPPGMTDADVNALYAKYVQAKQMVGERVGPEGRGKLIQTISSQAPKIMQQYNAKGVDFSVVVKNNQVIIRAKPKG
jgi:hypothetical protein